MPSLPALLAQLALLTCSAAQSNAATRRELPPSAAAAGAVALDGSHYVYYVAPGAEAHKYVIYQKGGGWCNSDAECAQRATTALGSSNASFYPAVVDYASFSESSNFALLQANATLNPMAWNWTRILLTYLDGGSQTGDLDAPVVVPLSGGRSRTIYYRGKRIHDATVAALLAREGLDSATDVLYGGGSAGALAVYLHADDWAAHLPQGARFAAVADSGFFLSYNASAGAGYAADMRWIVQRMNASLPAACLAANAADPASCIFAETAARTLSAPLFAQQSSYDTFQIQDILRRPLSDAAAINAYGATLVARLNASLLAPHPDAAVFLDSCAHHVGEWDDIVIDGTRVHRALQEFYGSIGKGGRRVWAQGQTFPCPHCCTGGQVA
jgi:hypothetical protein